LPILQESKKENGSLEKQRMKGMSQILVLKNGEGRDNIQFYQLGKYV